MALYANFADTRNLGRDIRTIAVRIFVQFQYDMKVCLFYGYFFFARNFPFEFSNPLLESGKNIN